jgi:hypothetical protein
MERPTERQLGGANNPGGWSATLPAGDAGNATLVLDGALAGVFECVAATSSPAGTVEGQTASGAWKQIESYQYTSGAYTRRAAGATVTLATGDLLYVPAPGFTHVRFKRSGGTSMTWTARTLENLEDILLIRLLVSGLTATITPPTVSYHYVLSDAGVEDLISASARKLYGVQAYNINDIPIYINLYDKATAPDENDTPIFRMLVPANATAANGAGSNVTFSQPIALTNGLGIRIMEGIAVTDDTKADANEVIANVQWSA